MNKLNIFKKVVSFTAAAGSGTIVGSIIKNNVEAKNIWHKISIPIGAFFIGGLVGSATGAYAESQIDAVVEAVKKAKDEIKVNTSS